MLFPNNSPSILLIKAEMSQKGKIWRVLPNYCGFLETPCGRVVLLFTEKF